MIDKKQQSFIDAYNADEDTYMYLTGDGGTGKTFTIQQLIEQSKDSFKLAAYSTTASMELHKSATTLHSLLGLRIDNFGDSKVKDELVTDTIVHKNVNLSGHTLIVDEMSMIGEELLEIILKANADRIIFLGDNKQIPPIQSKVPKFPKGHTVNLTKNFRASNPEVKSFVESLPDHMDELNEYAEESLPNCNMDTATALVDEKDYTFISFKNTSILAMSNRLYNTENVYCKNGHIKGYFKEIDGRKNMVREGVSIRLLARNEDAQLDGYNSHNYDINFRNTKQLVEWSAGKRLVYQDEAKDAIIDYVSRHSNEDIDTWLDATNNEQFNNAQCNYLGEHTYTIAVSDPMFMMRYLYDRHIANIRNYLDNARMDELYKKKFLGLLDKVKYFDNDLIREGVTLNINGKLMYIPNYPNPIDPIIDSQVYKEEKQARIFLQHAIYKYLEPILLSEKVIKEKKSTGYKLFTMVTLASEVMRETHSNQLESYIRLKLALHGLYYLTKQFDQTPCFIDSRSRTADACQGRSIANVIVDLRGMSKQRKYVALSRARENIIILKDEYDTESIREETARV